MICHQGIAISNKPIKQTAHLSEWLKSKTLIPSAGKDVDQHMSKLSYVADGNSKYIVTQVWFLKELNTLLPYNPVIALLVIYPNNLKTCINIKMCAQMFKAALFIIAQTWKQPNTLEEVNE